MISNIEIKTQIPFENTVIGNTFMYCDKPYLVMDECKCPAFSMETKVNCVCLTDGHVAWFGPNVPVYPIECELNEVKQ